MADYQEYRRRILHRRWRRMFITAALLILLVLLAAVGVLWKRLHREPAPNTAQGPTILQQELTGSEWNTISYTPARRLRCVRDEMLTGAMLFSAVFLLNEPYTCAHHRLGRILYGVMVGAFTMGFRYFGVYETGVCFAILAVNSISGWLDRTEVRLHELIKSGRNFKEKKTGKGDAE